METPVRDKPVSTQAKPRRMRIVDALRALQKTYPATFKRLSEKRVPLKVGILDDIIADGGVDAVFPEDMPLDERRAVLMAALKVYTSHNDYVIALTRGGPRYDLTGQPVANVASEHMKSAAERELPFARVIVRSIKMSAVIPVSVLPKPAPLPAPQLDIMLEVNNGEDIIKVRLAGKTYRKTMTALESDDTTVLLMGRYVRGELLDASLQRVPRKKETQKS